MTLHGLLETAVQDGIIPFNVAHLKFAANASQRKAKGEKQARIRAKIFSREQLILFYVPLTNMRQVTLVVLFAGPHGSENR